MTQTSRPQWTLVLPLVLVAACAPGEIADPSDSNDPSEGGNSAGSHSTDEGCGFEGTGEFNLRCDSDDDGMQGDYGGGYGDDWDGDDGGDGDGDFETLPNCEQMPTLEPAIPVPEVALGSLALTFTDDDGGARLVSITQSEVHILHADATTTSIDLGWSTDDPLVVSGHVTADAFPDILVVDPAVEGMAQLLIQDQFGEWAMGASIPTVVQPRGAAISDFNGDFIADLALGNEVFLGDGLGGYALDQIVGAEGPLTVAERDDFPTTALIIGHEHALQSWRHAADLELLFDPHNQGETTHVAIVQMGGGSGDDLARLAVSPQRSLVSFWIDHLDSWSWSYTVDLGQGPDTMAVGDINGNGDDDLILAGQVGDAILILDLAGTDSPTCRTSLPLPFGVTDAALGDMDADGRSELAISDGQQTQVLRFED